jgi:hypothetical protein
VFLRETVLLARQEGDDDGIVQVLEAVKKRILQRAQFEKLLGDAIGPALHVPKDFQRHIAEIW